MSCVRRLMFQLSILFKNKLHVGKNGPHFTIADALNAAGDADVIIVEKGHVEQTIQSVSVEYPVTICGAGGGRPEFRNVIQ